MAEQEPTYESRRDRILEYIRKNPNCTKAVVIRYMIGNSAVTTTHAILKDMIRDGKVNVYKKNLQTHLLTINEDNVFFKINNMLIELDVFMDLTMGEHLDKLKIAFRKGKVARDITDKRASKIAKWHSEFLGWAETDHYLLTPFIESLDLILTNMLTRISQANISDKERLTFTKKTVDLLNKLTGAQYYSSEAADVDSVLEDKIALMKEGLKKGKHIQGYAKKHDIDLNMSEELASIVKKYRNFIATKQTKE